MASALVEALSIAADPSPIAQSTTDAVEDTKSTSIADVKDTLLDGPEKNDGAAVSVAEVDNGGIGTVEDSKKNLDEGTEQDDSAKKAEDQTDDQDQTAKKAQVEMEAEQAFLEMFRDLRLNLYDKSTAETVVRGGPYEYIERHEKDMPLEWRIRRSRHLSFVFQAYFRLMEDRVAALEDGTIGKLSKHLRNPSRERRRSIDSDGDSIIVVDPSRSKEDENSPGEPKKEEVSIPTLNRAAWGDFKRKYDQPQRIIGEEHAIDVLSTEPVIPHEVWRDRYARRNPLHLADLGRILRFKRFFNLQEPSDTVEADQPELSAQKESLTSGAGSESTKDLYPPMPDRIRINGGPLKQLLGKLLELNFKKGPVVLIKPFKLLVQHNDQIRGLYEQLKRKFATTSPTIAETNSDNDTGNELPDRPHGEVSELLNTYGTHQAYLELGCLIEFMDNDLKVLRQFKASTVGKIAFSDLWHIFEPGVEVITSQKPINAYRVLHVTGGRPYLSPPEDSDPNKTDSTYRLPEKASDFVVNCYYIDFDGKKFGPVAKSFSIQKFDDLRDIATLPVYPLRFAKDTDKTRETLVINGQKFLDVSRGGHVQYRGSNLHEVEELDSEIVVDFHAALWDGQDKDEGWQKKYRIEFGISPPGHANTAEVLMVSRGGCKERNCCENDYIFDDLSLDHQRMEDFMTKNDFIVKDLRYLNDDQREIPDEDIILFPHRLFAFILKDRKWAVVDVNNIKQIVKPAEDTWSSLVLPRGHKEMVYSLVQAHFQDRQHGSSPENDMQVDLIRGKGKGLIILLHGAPGVGKTSTAECVAELCQLPLYPITCGDLGITAVEVEKRLKRIFVQAQKWKCVLLLDEADVFLSQRGNDVKHNSLVSVFLRILEYYQGILFLTTNRVGKMDEAFRSRVHVSLYYPPLDKDSAMKIFRTNIERTKKHKGDKMKVRVPEIEQFAEFHYETLNARVRWNGRQIRNAFHIAIALAENEAAENAKRLKESGRDDKKPPRPTLRAEHFQVVEDASCRFDEYLTTVIGMGQSERAGKMSYRRDDWKEDKSRRPQRVYFGHASDSSVDSEEDNYVPAPPQRRRTSVFMDDFDDRNASSRRKAQSGRERERYRERDRGGAYERGDYSDEPPTTRETNRSKGERNVRNKDRDRVIFDRAGDSDDDATRRESKRGKAERDRYNRDDSDDEPTTRERKRVDAEISPQGRDGTGRAMRRT